jgi:RNA 2',3'-cyclic 3'-phosphodiesterase
MRAFVAIALPEPARRAISTARLAFIDAAPEWRGEKWVAEDNLHVTLRFLGSVDESMTESVAAAIASSIADLPPFALTLGGVTGRPSGRARMLWVRVADGVGPARELFDAVDGALTPLLDLPAEGRGYTPHVTLARLRTPRRVPPEALAAADAALDSAAPACGVAAPSPTVVSVPGVSVMSSRTLPAGPVYEELAFVPFGLD